MEENLVFLRVLRWFEIKTVSHTTWKKILEENRKGGGEF